MAPTANLDQKDKQFVAKVSAWRSRAGMGAGYLHVVGKTPKLGFNSPPWTTGVPPRLGLPSVDQSQGLMASVQPMVPAPCFWGGERWNRAEGRGLRAGDRLLGTLGYHRDPLAAGDRAQQSFPFPSRGLRAPSLYPWCGNSILKPCSPLPR